MAIRSSHPCAWMMGVLCVAALAACAGNDAATGGAAKTLASGHHADARYEASVRVVSEGDDVALRAWVEARAPWHLAPEYPSSVSVSAGSAEAGRTAPAGVSRRERVEFDLPLAAVTPTPRAGETLEAELRFGLCREASLCEPTGHTFELVVGATP